MTFKLLPEASGGYTVKLAGSTSVDDKVMTIFPINIETGAAAEASQASFIKGRTQDVG